MGCELADVEQKEGHQRRDKSEGSQHWHCGPLTRNRAGRLGARVLDVSAPRVVGGLIALAMLLGGGFLALAGMGYIGESGGTSRSWSMIGSLLAGLGVALVITIFSRHR